MQVKILIVDYYAHDRELIVYHLKQTNLDIGGFEVRYGLDALKTLRKKTIKFDLVMARANPRYFNPPHGLIEMTGLDLLKAIRADADTDFQSIPFIMVGLPQASTASVVAAAKDAGANYYITKSITEQYTEGIKSVMGIV